MTKLTQKFCQIRDNKCISINMTNIFSTYTISTFLICGLCWLALCLAWSYKYGLTKKIMCTPIGTPHGSYRNLQASFYCFIDDNWTLHNIGVWFIREPSKNVHHNMTKNQDKHKLNSVDVLCKRKSVIGNLPLSSKFPLFCSELYTKVWEWNWRHFQNKKKCKNLDWSLLTVWGQKSSRTFIGSINGFARFVAYLTLSLILFQSSEQIF